MSIYPDPTDTLDAGANPDGSSEGHARRHGRIINLHENVMAYGATGDGTTDDTAAIQDALDAVLRPSSDLFCQTLYFPWTEASYLFDAAALDWYATERVGAAARWITILIDGTLKPTSTITFPPHKLRIIGGTSGRAGSFAPWGYTQITCSELGTDPVITFETGHSSTTFYMEGFVLYDFQGRGLYLPGDEPDLTFSKMFFKQATGAGAYDCVYLAPSATDNFNIRFFECGFDTQTATGYSLNMHDIGALQIENCYVAKRGIRIASSLGGCGTITIRNVLAENLNNATLTLDSTSGPVESVHVFAYGNADSVQSPSCILKNTGTQTSDVVLRMCGGSTTVLEAGSDMINGLDHRVSGSTSGTTLGQDQRYMHVDRYGRMFFGAARMDAMVTKTSGSTISGSDSSFYQMSYASPGTINNIQFPLAGAILEMLFTNGNCTIAHNATCRLAGGVNFTGTTNDMLRLRGDGTVWYEVSRSLNG